MNIFQSTDIIAIKLSVLSEEMLEKLLLNFSFTYVIDAEHHRLDLWIQQFEQRCILDSSELAKRLIITVQAARDDAEDQLVNLSNFRVLLVVGHPAYTKSRRKVTSLTMAKLWDTFSNISYIGASAKMARNIQKKVSRPLLTSQIVELLGNQGLQGSMLYTYVSVGNLSQSAISYLERRSGGGPFIIPIEELNRVREKHIPVLFIDFHGSEEFLSILSMESKCGSVLTSGTAIAD